MFSGIGVLPVLLCPGCSPAFPRCSRTQGVPEVFPRCSRCRGVFKVFQFNVSPFPRRSQCGNTVQGVPNAFPCPRRSHGVPKFWGTVQFARGSTRASCLRLTGLRWGGGQREERAALRIQSRQRRRLGEYQPAVGDPMFAWYLDLHGSTIQLGK
jgi:hypothetical protein